MCKGQNHTLLDGETWQSVALASGTTIAALKALNPATAGAGSSPQAGDTVCLGKLLQGNTSSSYANHSDAEKRMVNHLCMCDKPEHAYGQGMLLLSQAVRRARSAGCRSMGR